MTLNDINLIAKKILAGVIVTTVPALLLLGALWFTQQVLSSKQKVLNSTPSTVKRTN